MSQIKQKQKHWSALVFTAVNFLPGNVCLISTVKGIRTLALGEKLGNVKYCHLEYDDHAGDDEYYDHADCQCYVVLREGIIKLEMK